MRRLLTLLTILILSGCATEEPPSPNEIGNVHIRNGAEHHPSRTLDESETSTLAAAILPFARLASRAYCLDFDPENITPDQCKNTSPLLEADGWMPLFDSKSVLPASEQTTKLSFLAFYRVNQLDAAKGDVVFAFRGTYKGYASDWYANLHWLTRFLPFDDQYDILYRNEPQLILEAKRLASKKAPGVRDFDVYSTGHSLGGGLAQLFAYGDKSVKAAITFDPSPVTGYKTTVKDDRVNCESKILRIYERGEILQYLRSVMRGLYTPTNNISQIDFEVFSGSNSIQDHSINSFTDSLTSALAAVQGRDGLSTLDRTKNRFGVEQWLPDSSDEACVEERISARTH